MFVKNMPGLLFWGLLPAHVVATLLFLLRAAADQRLQPTMRGFAHGVRGLPRVWRQRRAIQQRRSVSAWRIARALSWSPVAAIRRAPDVRITRRGGGSACQPTAAI